MCVLPEVATPDRRHGRVFVSQFDHTALVCLWHCTGRVGGSPSVRRSCGRASRCSSSWCAVKFRALLAFGEGHRGGRGAATWKVSEVNFKRTVESLVPVAEKPTREAVRHLGQQIHRCLLASFGVSRFAARQMFSAFLHWNSRIAFAITEPWTVRGPFLLDARDPCIEPRHSDGAGHLSDCNLRSGGRAEHGTALS